MPVKTSLKEFSDRDLLLVIIGSQVRMYRDIQFLQQKVEGKSIGDLDIGSYEDTFAKLVEAAENVMNQAQAMLKKDEDGLRFTER
ncbi:MAG: hypothetical protein EOP04_29280 [Proteobacteria bacterium]|nr:MAG: hypothetical protein EOP04_29280 [Pseudomonadota bacterium]